MNRLLVAGVVVLSIAIGLCVVLGTLGWLAVGFGMMTDCTNNYDCTATGCAPCATTSRWINAGGVAQWVLACTGTVLLVRGVRARRAGLLAMSAAAVLAVSVLTIVGTTWRAQASYCQPGTSGYSTSYCSTDA